MAELEGNPIAAGLRWKHFLHWDAMNAMWSSSRANGFTASSMLKCNRRIRHQFYDEAGVLGNKINRPPDQSTKLFSTMESLALKNDYLYECFEYLDSHDDAVNRFLTVPEHRRLEMWKRIMAAI